MIQNKIVSLESLTGVNYVIDQQKSPAIAWLGYHDTFKIIKRINKNKKIWGR